MSDLFQVQGFGVLSNWNGQVASATAADAMAQIAATGANSIEITPRIWTASQTASTVFADPDKTESDASLIQGILTAEQDGLSVVIKPAITGLDNTMSPQLAPADIPTFFATYKAEIVHLAQIAQETGVQTFAIGNELGGLSTAPYLSYWTDIIQSVHAVYSGQLTYAAATDEIYKVSFWNQLDTIGANMYPPLSVPADPTVQDIVDAWHQPPPAGAWWTPTFEYMSPYDFLQSVAAQYGKPVLMTEAGYCSVDYNGQISGVSGLAGPLDVQEQADAYQAFFQVWGPAAGTWLQGVEFWNWDLDGNYSPNGFSPMGKPAQAIVTAYFKGQGALATDVAALDPTDIANLAALGIKALAVTDNVVSLSAAQSAALGTNGITLTEPYGTGSQTWTYNADGSVHDVAYYAISGDTATTTDVLYAASQPAGSDSNGAAAAWPTPMLQEVTVTGITGQPWTSSDTLYGENGQPTNATWRNGDTVVQTESWNPDGSISDIHYYGITGQAYTDYDLVYDANGRMGEAVYSSGMTQSWSYNADGSLHETLVAGLPDGTSTDTIYGQNDTPLSETWLTGSAVTQTEAWNPDGSIHDIHYYGITGQAYTDYDLVYDVNGRVGEAVYSNGMTQSWSYNADGSLHETLVAGLSDGTSTDTIYGQNSTPLSETWLNGSTVTQTEAWNPDGSIHDIHTYGQGDADCDLIYGPDGRKAEAVYASGMTQAWSYTPDGLLYESTLTGVVGAGYTSSIAGFGTNGQNVVDQYANVDGTETIRGIADNLTFTSAAAGTDVMTADGVTFGFAPNANTMLTGGGANETFVFNSGFGQATITDFAQGHDTLVFAPGTFADVGDALGHAAQSGANIVMTDHAGDTLVLQNASLAQLTATNIRV
jgi:hypothetical protein